MRQGRQVRLRLPALTASYVAEANIGLILTATDTLDAAKRACTDWGWLLVVVDLKLA
ncbi:MAG TPA: hypothetical protein PLR76_08975 [Hyphomonas sp.]|nr:hypothetical protein [Hyphomonas sp.]MCB9961067.1 hypothetical protein [Hyphomonas sp.]MCB9970358.1 hypothetical protein [Hyphomonas sp.]HPE48517.1 hypothetical protein [Hyphomonas sp.]